MIGILALETTRSRQTLQRDKRGRIRGGQLSCAICLCELSELCVKLPFGLTQRLLRAQSEDAPRQASTSAETWRFAYNPQQTMIAQQTFREALMKAEAKGADRPDSSQRQDPDQ